MRIAYKVRIAKETIRQKIRQHVPMSNGIRQMRMAWACVTVLRLNDDGLTKRLHQWKPTRKRSRGRPKKGGWTVSKRTYDEPV